MTALPLADASVDVVVSNLAIHNIPSCDGHAARLREIGWGDVRWRRAHLPGLGSERARIRRHGRVTMCCLPGSQRQSTLCQFPVVWGARVRRESGTNAATLG